MLKPHFKHSLSALGSTLHYAAHSHHPWPDCTLIAQQQYWLDSATKLDKKWVDILGDQLPRAQDRIADLLQWPIAPNIAFAPNTGEFVARLYSALDWSTAHLQPLTVVTSASEFHSFERQTKRLEETGRLRVVRIEVHPIESFTTRMIAAIQSNQPDMVFCSHVFFDTGLIEQNLELIVDAAPENTIIAFDGYHSVMAIPVNASNIASRAFYIGGGYKYAMAGEGCCFMAVPEHSLQLRPAYTGWFAAFNDLAGEQNGVDYANDGYRFFGATFDASGIYRFNAVQDWLAREGIAVSDIRAHTQQLKTVFIDGIMTSKKGTIAHELCETMLYENHSNWLDKTGSFLSFDLNNRTDHAITVEAKLKQLNVYIDRRGDRVRFGFGVYQDSNDVQKLLQKIT